MKKSIITYPYYSYHISPRSYNKQQLVDNILTNYQTNPSRNMWDKTCDMHHEYNDRDNSNFIPIDYSTLLPIYYQKVEEFISELNLRYSCTSSLHIQNYTVTTHAQTMKTHCHLPCQFAAVHYVKFNHSEHQSTMFSNPSPYANLLPMYYHMMYDRYIQQEINLPVVEDELIIFPAMMNHHIVSSHSSTPRITIAFNIMLERKV